jgi:hypothetical protein
MPDGVTASPLTFDTEVTGNVARVRCHGQLTMGYTNLLQARVKKLIPEHKRIVVSARSAGCSLELMNLSHGIQKVLSLTNLLGVFTVVGESGLKVG